MNIQHNIQKSQELQAQVEAFLASGGTINKLPIGHSFELNTDALKLNKKQRASLEKTAHDLLTERRKSQLVDQCRVMAAFRRKAKIGHIKMLAEHCGVSQAVLRDLENHAMREESKWEELKAKILSFDYPEMYRVGNQILRQDNRKNRVRMAADEARANRVKIFKAECGVHGETDYSLDCRDAPFCRECRAERQRKLKNKGVK